MIEEIPQKYGKQLTPDDFYLPRLRYVDPAPYTQAEFERAYNWMVTVGSRRQECQVRRNGLQPRRLGGRYTEMRPAIIFGLLAAFVF